MKNSIDWVAVLIVFTGMLLIGSCAIDSHYKHLKKNKNNKIFTRSNCKATGN